MSPIDLALIVFELFVMVISISLHDCAQAWVANRLGDPTARMLGRITMNPAQHFDPWGMGLSPLLSIFIFHNPLPFGWGKPVPTTYRNFRSKNGEVISVIAGPVAQLLAAIGSLVVLLILKHAVQGAGQSLGLAILLSQRVMLNGLGDQMGGLFPVFLLLYMLLVMNLFLLVFNLLPMPFLDGGKILVRFLPYNAAKAFEQYSMYFVLAFFFIGGPLISIGFTPLLAIFNTLLISL
jgi:Zn-dependent protease